MFVGLRNGTIANCKISMIGIRWMSRKRFLANGVYHKIAIHDCAPQHTHSTNVIVFNIKHQNVKKKHSFQHPATQSKPKPWADTIEFTLWTDRVQTTRAQRCRRKFILSFMSGKCQLMPGTQITRSRTANK